MANIKINYDEQEVDEIIQFKLKKLGGVRKKLTPNNVKTFNEEIAEKPCYIRANGQMFKKYSYTFWIDKNYYGNQKVKEYQEEEEDFTLLGEAFIPEVKDIILLVNKYQDNPQQLTKSLIKIFEDDKKELADLRAQVSGFSSVYQKLKNDLDQFKIGFATVFMNSIESHNSLNDVLSLKKSEDKAMFDELELMFNGDFSYFGQVEDTISEDATNSNVLCSSQSIEDKIRKLEEEGL